MIDLFFNLLFLLQAMHNKLFKLNILKFIVIIKMFNLKIFMRIINIKKYNQGSIWEYVS
jgi:hypothetical protein